MALARIQTSKQAASPSGERRFAGGRKAMRACLMVPCLLLSLVASQAVNAEGKPRKFAVVVHAGKTENCAVVGEGVNIKKGRWLGGDNFKMRGSIADFKRTSLVCRYPDGKTKVSNDYTNLFNSRQSAQHVTIYMPKDRSKLEAHSTGIVYRGRNQYEWTGKTRFTWTR